MAVVKRKMKRKRSCWKYKESKGQQGWASAGDLMLERKRSEGRANWGRATTEGSDRKPKQNKEKVSRAAQNRGNGQEQTTVKPRQGTKFSTSKIHGGNSSLSPSLEMWEAERSFVR